MGRITLSSQISAPPERTFDVFTDIDRWAENVDGIVRIEKLTEGPLRIGTRWRETRVMFKKEMTEEMEISALQPLDSYTVSAESCGMKWDSTFRFAPDGEGTRVEFEILSQAQTFMAKLMTPLGWLMAGAMKKHLEKDMSALKAAAEAAP